jgi:hypothetical protein
MRRLILIVVILCVLFGLGNTIARGIGLRHPPSDIVQQLHMHDCEAPCFMGVTVGKTSLGEAKQQILKIDPLPGYKAEISMDLDTHAKSISYRLVGQDLSDIYDTHGIYISFAQGKVDAVRIGSRTNFSRRTNRPRLRLGNILSHYGTPTCVFEDRYVGGRIPTTTMIYRVRNTTITVWTPQPSWWDTPVAMTIRVNSQDRRDPCTCSSGEPLSKVWVGDGPEQFTFLADNDTALVDGPCAH